MESKELAEKHLGQAVGAEKAAELWAGGVINMAPSSEKVTTSFVDACFTVNARLLSNEKLQLLCEDADSAGVTPLDSIYKYEAIVKRASSPQLIYWCVAGLLDLVKMKLASPGDISLRQLSGRGLPGGKGILDTLIAKRELACAIVEKLVDMGSNKCCATSCLPGPMATTPTAI